MLLNMRLKIQTEGEIYVMLILKQGFKLWKLLKSLRTDSLPTNLRYLEVPKCST